ncbi:MAG TPA: universal stress protein [Candidatus Dormibacteraeota bacterium]|nr:universal stress protein [Candidatus Dormibacteraeota bacterium]
MERELGFRRILLATDGSEQAAAAVDATIKLARYSPATVRVFHVWNLDVHHRHGFWDVEVHAEAERLVQDTVDRLTRAGVMAEKEVFRADPDLVADAIAATVRQIRADLVVMGSRGLSSWQSLIRHSVSHQVLAAVDCPVLIIRAGMHGSFANRRRVLVAVAGGDDVKVAVKAAAAVMQPVESVAMVVHVAQAMVGAQGFAYVESDEEINATMDRACAALRDAGITTESRVLRSGPVARGIAEIAAEWDADLIVTGSSRMGDVASSLLGSVSYDLLHNSDLPVLIAERMKN